jgi:hypothetical protein
MFEFLKKWFKPKKKHEPVVIYTRNIIPPQSYDDILQHVLNETWNSDDGTFTFEEKKGN